MTGRRATLQAARRASQQSQRLGEEVRLARVTLAWTIQDVARRAGVAWDTVVRIEDGDSSIGLETACAVTDAVGLDLVLKVYPGRQPTLRDTGQLIHAESLRRQAHGSWQVDVEVSAGPNGEAIDVVLFGSRQIIAIEIERMTTDFQAQYRRAVRKREVLAGQHRRQVRLVIAIEDNRRNRRALEPHQQLIGFRASGRLTGGAGECPYWGRAHQRWPRLDSADGHGGDTNAAPIVTAHSEEAHGWQRASSAQRWPLAGDRGAVRMNPDQGT